jgi:hypothetical protein
MTTTNEPHTPDGCLMCAVRALTEGEPTTWWPNEPASVKGVVLKIGRTPSRFAFAGETVQFVDLWLGGTTRVRVVAYGVTLDTALTKAAPTVGDTLTVDYVGQFTIESGKHRGKPFRKHTVTVERGHH